MSHFVYCDHCKREISDEAYLYGAVMVHDPDDEDRDGVTFEQEICMRCFVTKKYTKKK